MDEDEIEIKSSYDHEHSPSVFVMFTKTYQVVWCYSGNELRRVYLERPEDFISEPLELPIPRHLDRRLTARMDNI
jgi:hypothetical protein